MTMKPTAGDDIRREEALPEGEAPRRGVTPGSALGWAAFGAIAGVAARSVVRSGVPPSAERMDGTAAADTPVPSPVSEPLPESKPSIRISDLYVTGM